MDYNYFGGNTFANDSHGNKNYRLAAHETNPVSTSNIISVLTNPNLSQLFSEEEIFKMQMYLKVSVVDSLKGFTINEQKQEEQQSNGMHR